jgi:hypothetical protein
MLVYRDLGMPEKMKNFLNSHLTEIATVSVQVLNTY